MISTRKLLALLLVAGAAPAFAQTAETPAPEQGAAAAAQPGAKPSKQAVKALSELQKAYAANDPAAISAALAAANAAAATKDDRYIIGQLQLKAALAANDNAAVAAAIETIAASNYLDSTRVAGLYLAQGSTFYKAKQYPQASAAFERGLALDPTNDAFLANLAETRFAQGRTAESIDYFKRLIAAKRAAGAKPDENIYKRAVVVANGAKLPVAVELGQQWVTAYPNAESWRNAIALYQNYNTPDVQPALDLLRLMRAAGGLSDRADYELYSTAAAEQGNYAEAKAVIDEGLSKSAFQASSPVIAEVIAGLKSKNIATAADLAQATRDAKDGKAYLRIGDRYYGLNDFAKAAELYRMAQGKPGVDAGLVNLHLGMALARSGDKAGAIAALNQVSGTHAAVAKYWLLYANQMA